MSVGTLKKLHILEKFFGLRKLLMRKSEYALPSHLNWHHSRVCANLLKPQPVGGSPRLVGGQVKSNIGLRIVSGASLTLAILQSICTAVLTINGIRLAIGLTAFVMASSVIGPLRWFHQDAIRIPMLWIAAIGATIDIAVLWWTRRLRIQPAAQWRRRELSGREKRSRGFQLALAVVTLLLVSTEAWTHHRIHGSHPRAQSSAHQASSVVAPSNSKHI
jgi:hypothetical protein